MKIFLQIVWSLAYLFVALVAAGTADVSYLIIAVAGFLIYVLGEIFIKSDPRLKWITRLAVIFIVLIYIKWPKKFTQCGEIGVCGDYECNGIIGYGTGGFVSCDFGDLQRFGVHEKGAVKKQITK